MEGVDLLGRGRQSVLAHGRNDLLHLLSQALRPEVVELPLLRPEWLAHNHGAGVVGAEHLLALLSGEEADVDRVLEDGLLVVLVGAPDDLHVGVEEAVLEVAAGPQVEQIHDTVAAVLGVEEVVGWVGIGLHHLELEELLEAELDQQGADAVPEVLRLFHVGVDFPPVHELRAEDGPGAQVVDDLRAVEVIGVLQQVLSVSALVGSLPLVVALPVQLVARDVDGFVEVEAAGEDAEHVDDSLEVVEVAVDAVRDPRVLHLDGHAHVILQDGLVHLANARGGEGVEVDLLEVLLPLRP
mmetsp:Transcript_13124/g.22169  ORF Transcript_13124/g.22169 Transcript_13124/m.22169 type:complete len:297 (-) Transcript_13124:963-1853(-)